MKRFALIALSAALCAGTVFVQGASAQNGPARTAASIVQDSRGRINAETVSSRSRMVITAKNGSTSERVIDQYSKDDPKGNDRMVIVFQQPASVRGTRFLTLEKTAGGKDQWIYLPSLGKVRRIAASEGSGSFMGTDMSYDDLNAQSRKADEDTHTILREEPYSGAPCYVIQSMPKDSSYQYGKMILWIDKATLVNYKIEMYDRRGTLVKVMESSGFHDVQGYLTPAQIKVSTLAAGTYTTIHTDIIKYGDPIPEGVFTTAYLETGRAR
jgi:outer membrane lipoprotein-sorting protein